MLPRTVSWSLFQGALELLASRVRRAGFGICELVSG